MEATENASHEWSGSDGQGSRQGCLLALRSPQVGRDEPIRFQQNSKDLERHPTGHRSYMDSFGRASSGWMVEGIHRTVTEGSVVDGPHKMSVHRSRSLPRRRVRGPSVRCRYIHPYLRISIRAASTSSSATFVRARTGHGNNDTAGA